MSDLITTTSTGLTNGLMPLPRCAVTVRAGAMSDLAFIDGLQKKHTKQVGWMPTMQLEGKIRAGHVLVAVGATPASPLSVGGGDAGVAATEEPLGYCMGNDQYFKRDDVGIIYQMNVVPGRQRGLIGATLLKAQFERSAWGCKLYCCWCAQDIEANRFWESMGFVALAFRTGARGRGPDGAPRVHIFWQRRIRSGDETTPYWFPSQTGSGAIREDRLVLPIPPGTHWSDAKPIVLPGAGNAECRMMNDESGKALTRRRSRRGADGQTPMLRAPTKQRVQFGGPGMKPAVAVEAKQEKPAEQPKPKRTKAKNDPRLVAAARELRDRWLEHANAHPEALVANGKYEVARLIDSTAEVDLGGAGSGSDRSKLLSLDQVRAAA